MKKENCRDCYYAGIKKCFMYNKKYEDIENCTEYLTDPYLHNQVGEYCKGCWYYQSNQCLGNELAKETCIANIF